MTTGPLASTAAIFPSAYLMWWKCVSERAQFCDTCWISDAIKSFYLEFFMINVRRWTNKGRFGYYITYWFFSKYMSLINDSFGALKYAPSQKKADIEQLSPERVRA